MSPRLPKPPKPTVLLGSHNVNEAVGLLESRYIFFVIVRWGRVRHAEENIRAFEQNH